MQNIAKDQPPRKLSLAQIIDDALARGIALGELIVLSEPGRTAITTRGRVERRVQLPPRTGRPLAIRWNADGSATVCELIEMVSGGEA